jgi:hypothetical protein
MVDVDQHAGGIHADHLAPQREGGVRGHDNLDLVTEVKKGTVLLLACGQRDVFLHVDVREALLDGIVKDLQIQAHTLARQSTNRGIGTNDQLESS